MEKRPRPERRAQTCIEAKPMYPSENDMDNAYNKWAADNIDQFLPDNGDRTSRTDPNKLITDIQDSIDIAKEAEYSAMVCRPIFDGIEAIVTIPDFVVLEQGRIVGGLKSIVCDFGNKVAGFATGTLYRQLERAQFHNYNIDGAESRATYINTGNMVNRMCTSGARLNRAVEELAAIKRKLDARL